MKLFGNTGKGRKKAKKKTELQAQEESIQEQVQPDDVAEPDDLTEQIQAAVAQQVGDLDAAETSKKGKTGKKEKKKTSTGRKVLKFAVVFVAAVALLLGGAYGLFILYIQPPDVVDPTQPPVVEKTDDDEDTDELDEDEPEVSAAPGRREGVYTFLVAGEDDEYGGTDVIMVGLLDTVNNELDIVSIPRDTIVNVPWGVKKINSYKNMYEYLEEDYDQYVDALIDGVENLIGYRVDSWITIDLEGFITLVDTIGGVEFDVPQRMYYSDPDQDLYIDLAPGTQTLDGYNAMGLVRYRSYEEGDIARVKVQQDFLMALAGQLLQMQNLFKLDDMVQIFRDNVDTDMSLQNLGFYANEFLKLDTDDIHFHSVDDETANITDSVNGISYVSLYVDEWVDMVNAYINPFTWLITVDDLEILTRDEYGAFYVTRGTYYDNWSY